MENNNFNGTTKIDAIFSKWDIEWWQGLSESWKIILLSNYCFNYDKYTRWTIEDCNLECPAYGNNQTNEEYLIGFALWVGGGLVGDLKEEFISQLYNIPYETLEFIIYKTRFLWCSGVEVSSLNPIKNLKSLSEISGLKVSKNQINKYKHLGKYYSIDYNEINMILNLKRL